MQHRITAPLRRTFNAPALLLLMACLWAAPPAGAHRHLRQPLAIPMRDAPTTLSADLYRPAESGAWPVILIQTPYNKDLFRPVFELNLTDNPLLQSPDYAFVVLDWRGFYGSAGAAYPGSPNRGEDGHDAVEWIAAQPWCTGEVGTWGNSALGNVQMKTAEQQPPHLRACVPITYHFREFYELTYPSGVWGRNRNNFVYDYFLSDALARAHPTYDAYWELVEGISGDVTKIDVPMLHVSGWFDIETDLTIREFRDIDRFGGEGARGRQWLLIGPWHHGGIGQSDQGGTSYPDTRFADTAEALAFFDYYLRGIDNGWLARPPVRYYRINEARWLEAPDWPPPGLVTRDLFLHADGSVSDAPPQATSATLAWTADPADPAPYLFGTALQDNAYGEPGQGDLSPLEAREDVLVFTSAVFEQPLVIEGNATATLWVSTSSSAPDTDVAVRLTQRTPGGESLLLADGIGRVSLREGFGEHKLMEPGVIYPLAIRLEPVSASIPAGQALRVYLTPAIYDRWDVNPQDGSDFSDADGVSLTPATFTLHFDADHPAGIRVPTPPAGPRSGAARWTLY